MAVSMKVIGLREIEKALAELPSGTAKGVARRAMKKELQPIALMANGFWPGSGDDVFRITSRLSPRQRPAIREARSVTNMFVGADYGPAGAPHAHLLEFGTGPRFQRNGRFTGSVAPMPMLQPAWDMHKAKLLEGLGARLWDEIRKTVERRARRAARSG